MTRLLPLSIDQERVFLQPTSNQKIQNSHGRMSTKLTLVIGGSLYLKPSKGCITFRWHNRSMEVFHHAQHYLFKGALICFL